MLDLYLIRHAECEINQNQHLIGGRSNESPLTEKGKKQALSLGRRFYETGLAFDEVHASTALRAYETARIACLEMGYSLDRIIQSEQLLELDQGDWVGKPRVEAYSAEVLQRIEADNWNFAPPRGESQRTVEERMKDYILPWVTPWQDLRAAVFTHGVAIKCFLRYVLDSTPKMTWKIDTGNTSVTRLTYNERGWNILTINDTAHLFSKNI